MSNMSRQQPETKKPQRVRDAGASEDNVKTTKEMNVMTKNSTAAAQIIPFRQAKLLLVNHEGQPFVPMKPVAEGMGLAWQVQHRKLMAGRFASTITEMVIVAQDGKQREMTCLPLRKLPGWLMSIHPNKVRPELREGIIAYQNECDDVLWSYWNEGVAVRNDDRTVETVLNSTIGTDGFHMLGALIKGKVSFLPSAVQRRATAKIWSQTHAAFGVRSAADIPADQLDAARNFIAAYAIEGEFLPRLEESAIRLTESQAVMVHHLIHHAVWVAHYWNSGIGEGARSMQSPAYPGCNEHLGEIERYRRKLDADLLPSIRDWMAGKLGARFSWGLRPGQCAARGIMA